VFGYETDRLGEAPVRFREDQVYFGQEILGFQFTPSAEDWAVVQVQRRVTGQTPIRISEKSGVAGDPVYVIGHPCGLPKKIAGLPLTPEDRGAIITERSQPSFFVTNLDAFGGNSGSPVLNSEHAVLGILVRGQADFVWCDTCRVAVTFPLLKGGEEVCGWEIWSEKLVNSKLHGLREPPRGLAKPQRMALCASSREILFDFLLSAFSPSEIRRLAKMKYGDNLSNTLPGRYAPPSHVAESLIEALERRGLLTSEFFEHLLVERPNRKLDIFHMRDACLDEPTKSLVPTR